MKTLLLTAFDDFMAPLGDLTAPLMLAYASRHGIDFRCVRQFPAGKTAYWHKMPRIMEAFNDGYNKVIWLDADQKVTNPDIIPPGDHGFNASLDWGVDATDSSCFSMAGFTAYQDSWHLFCWVIDHEESYVHGPFPEQIPMRFLYQRDESQRGVMTTHPRRAYNAVPIQVHPSVVEPWEPGDFCAHITHLPIEERIKIFHEI